MKKLICMILVLCMCLFLFACGSTQSGDETTETSDSTAADTTTDTSSTEEETPSINSIIKNAVLQYPASNDLFKYNVYDTYIEITEYIGDPAATEIIVPGTLDNLPVYVVDFDVFDKCDVPNIIFEEGIFKINSDFSGSVVRVTLPSTLDFIGSGTFENCYALETVIIPEGIDSIQFKAFAHCHALKEITIPSTVTRISSETFAFCLALETVNLPEGLTVIEDNAFTGCEALKTVVIPSTVEKIGADVFMSSGLEYIEIPESVQEMGHGTFSGCENLITVKVYNADMKIIPMEGYSVAILFSQHNPELVVHGKPASTIAQACASEDVFFEVIN